MPNIVLEAFVWRQRLHFKLLEDDLNDKVELIELSVVFPIVKRHHLSY